MARVSSLGGFAVATLAALALSAALATLISAITAGDNSPMRESCLRECRNGEHYTCRFDLRVHTFQTYSWNCKTCGNFSCTDRPGCIQADGVTRLITVVNEKLPGPTIQVCAGDTVKVNVRNHLVSSGVSIHWHGISMRGRRGEQGFPHMDGEPWVTQCPITPHSEFTYTFVADPPGTHFWHAQTGFQRGDGVFGPLIVKSPKHNDPNGHFYDEDLPDHVIMINDWAHILGEEKFFLHLLGGFTDYPRSILINGLGPHVGNSIVSVPHPVKQQRFTVVKGTKYRFRLINGAFLNCPVVVSFDEHLLTVIATDGFPVSPYNVTSILIHPGERWDFVLNANQYPQPYWISFIGQNDCVHDSVFQTAILDYATDLRDKQGNNARRDILPLSPKHGFHSGKPRRKQINGLNGACNSEDPCLRDLRSHAPLYQELTKEQADVTLYLAFSKQMVNRSAAEAHLPNVLKHLKLPPNIELPVRSINGLTFNAPSTPVILQPATQKTCPQNTGSSHFPLDASHNCLHLVHVPLGAVTDLIFIDEGINDKNTVVHLHGYRFYLLSETWGPLNDSSTGTYLKVDVIKKMDSAGKIKRNLVNPIQKDTIAIPMKGYAVVRFKADNPGFWMLESQLLFDSQLGMKLILQVGNDYEIPKPPPNFPNCRDFK